MARDVFSNGMPLSDEEFEAQLLTLPITYNEHGEPILRPDV